ncbi:hypothetical protein [Pseudonocardia nigra]|uniref:hypothetical protein n=1 Tax=Pseudonocardia nigra TaxID=1921578 RepID=UPI001C5F23E1|nr:hypothetical protein [Pseudonocardia nigra]
MAVSDPSARETYNPWTVVDLVFHHLAGEGLHPVLGGCGNPESAAAALLTALGIAPGRGGEGRAAAPIQAVLADMRKQMFPDVGE